MNFTVDKSLEILERTPQVLITMLQNISSDWTSVNEGGDTWSVYDIIGHLIHGEKTDWMPRTAIILSENSDKAFTPFDRFAQFEESRGKTFEQLLEEFKSARELNIRKLKALKLTGRDYGKTGIHPRFGPVTLSQLISTWAVHDLDHISQISRVMAKQFKEETGPWVEYLKILRS